MEGWFFPQDPRGFLYLDREMLITFWVAPSKPPVPACPCLGPKAPLTPLMPDHTFSFNDQGQCPTRAECRITYVSLPPLICKSEAHYRIR